jgi:hypothetical protein
MGGDLNGIMENIRGKQTMLSWISGLRMTIPLTTLLLPRYPDFFTWTAGEARTRIDHIGISRTPDTWSISQIGVDSDSPHRDISDHRLIYIGMSVESFEGFLRSNRSLDPLEWILA